MANKEKGFNSGKMRVAGAALNLNAIFRQRLGDAIDFRTDLGTVPPAGGMMPNNGQNQM